MLEALEQIKRVFSKGLSREFLIWGDINDYLPVGSGYIGLRQFLLDWLKNLVDVAVFYDISSGMNFPLPEHEKKFRELTGLTKRKPPEPPKDFKKWTREEQREFTDRVAQIESVPEPPLPSEPDTVFNLLRALMENSFGYKEAPKIALVINYAEKLAPAKTGDFPMCDRISVVHLQHLALSENIGKGSLTILLTKNPADVHQDLRGRGTLVASAKIPFPSKKEELPKFLEHTLRVHKMDCAIPIAELAHLTAGLTLREIENIFKLEGAPNIQTIQREKARFFDEELGGIVKLKEPRWGLDRGLAGLEHIKDFIRELKPSLLSGDPLLVPPAILLMGPSGTGKSALAEVIAWEWGVPFLEFMNNRSMWHGETERMNLQVWSMMEALHPCVLFMDEFDQEEAPRGSWQGDSGVSSRLRQMRFKIVSDPRNRGKFLVIYATNRPDLVDLADKQSHRASVRVPMLIPDAQEQEKIFQLMPVREGFETEVRDFGPIVKFMRAHFGEHGEYVSGANIEDMSNRAYRFAKAGGRKMVTAEDYRQAIEDFLLPPISVRLIREWEELAVAEASSKRLLSRRGQEISARIWKNINKFVEKKKERTHSQVV